jgi:hypothetical protein
VFETRALLVAFWMFRIDRSGSQNAFRCWQVLLCRAELSVSFHDVCVHMHLLRRM